MMICEWLTEDGKIASYDNQSNLFLYLHLDRSPMESPRTPTEQELAEYQARYPVVVVDPNAVPPREQLIANLMQALSILRGVTGDQVVTSNEINSAFGVVVPSLEKLRDYGPQLDDELVYLAVLVLSQICMSLFILANQLGAGYQAIAAPQVQLRVDVNAMATQIQNIINDLASHTH